MKDEFELFLRTYLDVVAEGQYHLKTHRNDERNTYYVKLPDPYFGYVKGKNGKQINALNEIKKTYSRIFDRWHHITLIPVDEI